MTGPRDDRSGISPSRRPGSAPSGAGYAGAGLQLAFVLVAFMFLGIWLDRRLGSSPWFVIICVFVGFAAGFYSIYRKLMGKGTSRTPDAGSGPQR